MIKKTDQKTKRAQQKPQRVFNDYDRYMLYVDFYGSG